MAYMDEKDFNEVVNDTCQSIINTLGSKAGEYSRCGDRLHNFNQIARVNDRLVEDVIWGMASKHLSCIMDMVNGLSEPNTLMVHEKIGDMINYLVILKAHFLNDIKLRAEGIEKLVEIEKSQVAGYTPSHLRK